jgi:hypothetical protein
MTAHSPVYTNVVAVRKLANNPRTADISNTEIDVEIEAACDDMDTITHRVGNPFTMNESYAELIERNTRRLAAANVIENFDTYNNIQLSFEKGEFLRNRAIQEINDWLGTQVSPSLDEAISISVSSYETTEAAKDEGQLTPPVYRSTDFFLPASNDYIKEKDYSKRFQ